MGVEPPFNGKINDGFNRIAAGEDMFRNELRSVIARNYPKRTFNAFTVFADLTYEFIDDLYKPEFSKAASIMREVASEMLPLGPEDDLFGPVSERQFHTAKTAAREYEIPVSLLKSASRTEDTNQTLPTLYDKSFFEDFDRWLSADSVGFNAAKRRFENMIDRERVNKEIAMTRPGESLPLHAASRELQTSFDVAWSLADEGYLAIFAAEKPKPHWRISKTDIAEFRHRHISSGELRQLLGRRRSNDILRPEHDFTPIIHRSDVGEDFFSRPEIMRAF